MTAQWDDRLITRERALELAGTAPVYLEDAGVRGLFLRCAQCHQSCGQFRDGPGDDVKRFAERTTTVEEILSGVLRHLVMVHDVPLSGVGRQTRTEDGS
ncbi:hypothetical protein [Amycolatopsis alkalitolerans]|uniref:Uncharacterized protein n=1 Tax=Amycolatopsis alkalitolerans TaxID=2547244 RepID=A0A5C4LPH3_9PSEU|nr:hypothetical protein [Amycolatopsis alkalitolerans]TNC19063.1 hypothetical protein FG385_32880 [Amycolatopsis alkalitolerans]